MVDGSNSGSGERPERAAGYATYDPTRPIPPLGQGSASLANQRQRRARILAAIRGLLMEEGLEGVTVRRIAQRAGLAVQTIYNLVGPREEAIVEAISEYTRHVGLMAIPDREDPNAILKVVHRWIKSVEAAPEFCRQVCLIFFTPSRGIFYQFRDRQLKALQVLLARQQRCGIIRPDARIRDTAEQMILFASAVCVEWSDREFPLDQMHRRLHAAFVDFLAYSVAPEVRRQWQSLGLNCT